MNAERIRSFPGRALPHVLLHHDRGHREFLGLHRSCSEGACMCNHVKLFRGRVVERLELGRETLADYALVGVKLDLTFHSKPCICSINGSFSIVRDPFFNCALLQSIPHLQ